MVIADPLVYHTLVHLKAAEAVNCSQAEERPIGTEQPLLVQYCARNSGQVFHCQLLALKYSP